MSPNYRKTYCIVNLSIEKKHEKIKFYCIYTYVDGCSGKVTICKMESGRY